jgi:ABC-type uncharacterized transport system involved in gliding motility auxiliary subunit
MKSGRKALAIALLFAGLVLVNYLASQLPLRVDATADRIYTLSPGTRALLSKIEEPVTLDYYFSKDAAGLRVADKNYAERVQEMLRQYVRASHGKLTLNVINPKADSPEEERATAAGLQPQTVPGTGEQLYFGLVAIQADQQKTIPALSPQRESFLEYDLSQLVYSVQQITRKKLGLITSLPLRAEAYNPYAPMARPPEPGQLIAGEWERTFEIVPVEASATELPAGLDALAIVHPEGVSPKLQYSIDQFLLGGKPVFLAVDPSSQYFAARGGQAAMFGGTPNLSSDLPVLLKGYGVTYDPQQVVGDLARATQVQTGQGGVARLPVWLSLGRDDLDPKAQPVAQLESLLFVEPGSFRINEPAGVTVTPLVQTSDQTGEVMATTLQMMPPDQVDRQIIPSGKRTIAALLSGKFKTAFPDGAPKDADKKEDKSAPFPATDKPAAPAGLKESSGSSTLILVADTDWLLDAYSVRRVNFLGSQAAEPLNDNLAFASNAVEFLAGSQDLISIRGKGNALRPFTVVTKMLAEAQKKYQEQLTSLEARIGEVQSKLSALQAKRNDGGRLVATPEMQKTIDDFRNQEAAMNGERREIRRALREDIDALENRLLVINLFATPLLVGCFGLWFYRARRT